MSNRPMPAHHSVIEIPSGAVARTYGNVRGSRLQPYIIVAAAPVDANDPPPAGMVRVIVAPAKVAP